MGHLKTKLILCIVLTTLTQIYNAAGLYAQQPARILQAGLLFPEDEEAFFSYEIEDSNVELFISGNWHISSGAAWGWRTQTEDYGPQFLPGTRLPGFSPSPLANDISMTSSVWLDNKYFVSTSFTDDLESRSLIAGYRGDKSERLQLLSFGYGDFHACVSWSASKQQPPEFWRPAAAPEGRYLGKPQSNQHATGRVA